MAVEVERRVAELDNLFVDDGARRHVERWPIVGRRSFARQHEASVVALLHHHHGDLALVANDLLDGLLDLLLLVVEHKLELPFGDTVAKDEQMIGVEAIAFLEVVKQAGHHLLQLLDNLVTSPRLSSHGRDETRERGIERANNCGHRGLSIVRRVVDIGTDHHNARGIDIARQGLADRHVRHHRILAIELAVHFEEDVVEVGGTGSINLAQIETLRHDAVHLIAKVLDGIVEHVRLDDVVA